MENAIENLWAAGRKREYQNKSIDVKETVLTALSGADGY